MATGVPVVIARLPGITDLANIDGVTGLYVAPGNVEQLKEAMRRLGEDKVLRQRMGQAARQRIVEAFSWDQHVSRWEQLYARGEIEQP
jgi:glycosyltransferase involved in cell wall biosynthesis